MLPDASRASAFGKRNWAEDAAPPSPEFWRLPRPATLVIVPLATLRTVALPVSEMKTLPLLSTATPSGALRVADVAAAPSPVLPDEPVPAMVEMNPVDRVTLRMRWLV